MITRKQHLRRAIRLAKRNLDAILTIPPPLPVKDWAVKRRIMPKSVTAKAGPYSLALTPYSAEPQDSFFDPEVQTTVMCWASRTGKTECEMNLTGYTVDYDPCHILWCYPTLDSAKKWRKEFFNPMIAASPCFRGKIRDAYSRDADNTLLSVAFPGGRCAAIGANSPSGFRQIQAPRVICEEVDAMENSPEGDPVVLAFKRADNYPDSVQIVSSTPTITGASRVWSWLERSDFRKWFCPCPHCGEFQVWMWRHVKWERGNEKAAHLICEKCEKTLDDAQRIASVKAGEWRPTLPFTGIRGYWLNGINSLFPAKKGFVTKIHQFVMEHLTAKDAGAAAVKTWQNTFLSETYEEEGEKIDGNEILKRCEEYGPEDMPEGVLVLTAGVDVHRLRIEVDVKGWGLEEESWGIVQKVFHGDTEKDEVWANLDKFLLQTFRREDGLQMKIERTFVDMGHKDKRVLGFCVARLSRGIFPCRGINRVGLNTPPLLPAKPSTNNKARIPHWNIGVTVAKSTIYDRLLLPVGEARSMHFAKTYDSEFFKQLTAERRRRKFQYGKQYFIFEKEHEHVRNEALDLNVYALAALHSLAPIMWAKLAANLKKQAQAQNAAKSAQMVAEEMKPKLSDGAPADTGIPQAGSNERDAASESSAEMNDAGHITPATPLTAEETKMAPATEPERPIPAHWRKAAGFRRRPRW